ncbi:putative ABC transport system permease protein [Desulfovibrionales bacterium]
MSWYAFFGAIEQGFVYGIMVLGVYLTFRVLNFPDLTVDGSLPLGAAVSAVCIINGIDPFLSLVPALLAGFVAGVVTGVLSIKLRIMHLLSSILTMIALYSVNMRIMGKPNLALLGWPTVLDAVDRLGLLSSMTSLLIFAVIGCGVAGLLVWLLHTELGQVMRASGDNLQMVTSQGVNADWIIISGVGLSNALVAMAGALIAQNQGAADVNMGMGTIVSGLASVIVGETIFGRRGLVWAVVAVLLGSLVYRLTIALALSVRLGQFIFTPSDLNLVTAILVVLALIFPKLKQKVINRARA